MWYGNICASLLAHCVTRSAVSLITALVVNTGKDHDIYNCYQVIRKQFLILATCEWHWGTTNTPGICCLDS